MNKRRIVHHYRTETAGKYPNANDIAVGEIAIGTAKGDESIFIKNTNGEVVKGKLTPDLSNLISNEDFEPVSQAALNSISKGTLGTINGQSLEDGDITFDLSLIKIVSELPTENILDNKIYLLPTTVNEGNTSFTKWLYITESEQWEYLGLIKSDIDLSDYMKTADADKKYVAKSTNQNTSITTNSTGAMANFSDNGQAYLAVRPKTAKFLINVPYAAASFGVKDDGTAAFSHKTYTTYDSKTGAYSGAKNTAVLQFAGPTGLRYAKNSGSGNDVTEDMYKYVGVIDSPDENQRVYSAKQVDEIISGLTEQIQLLKQAVIDLGGTIE